MSVTSGQSRPSGTIIRQRVFPFLGQHILMLILSCYTEDFFKCGTIILFIHAIISWGVLVLLWCYCLWLHSEVLLLFLQQVNWKERASFLSSINIEVLSVFCLVLHLFCCVLLTVIWHLFHILSRIFYLLCFLFLPTSILLLSYQQFYIC
jgi:hypothetical protein